MVTVVVYAEGGILGGNDNARTISNSNALREELNRFMSKSLNLDDIRIVVRTSAGYKNAAKFFMNDSSDSKYLYVDLDRKPELRDSWFDDIEKDGILIPESDKGRVYFWIQEMEAWFLKQPQAIEKWAEEENFEKKRADMPPIGEDASIKNKDIERLAHKPSLILANLLKKRYLSNDLDKDNKRKKLIYGKLAHAPGIIAHLDNIDLQMKDAEFSSFISSVSLASTDIV